MVAFDYRAQTPEGGIDEGRLEASSRQEALRRLTGQGLRPLRLQAAAAGDVGAGSVPQGAGSRGFRLRKGVSHQALGNFTRQLASLLAAGVTLSRALHILGRQGSTAARECWGSVHDLVVDGNGLADAMAQHRNVFPGVYIAMVRAGETGGFLELVLGQIADFRSREKELKGKVISALIYPAVLLVLAIGVLIFLLAFFIPRFRKIFEGFGAALPWLTQVIIGASEIVTQYGLFAVLGVALAIYGLHQWLSTAAGKRKWQEIVLRTPVVGPLLARLAMTRFCRMLGTLVGAGVPLITALRVARESLGNQTLVDAVNNSIESVQKGEALATSLADCPRLFPPEVIEMITVAEESGRLDQELVRLADVADKELDGGLKTAVALAEPVLLFIMAAFIGTIFVGMVIPIFTIQEYIK